MHNSNRYESLRRQWRHRPIATTVDEPTHFVLGTAALGASKAAATANASGNTSVATAASMSIGIVGLIGPAAAEAGVGGASAAGAPGAISMSSSLPEDIAIMEVILRFLQLLCENHNADLQNYLRIQPNNKTSYNLVCETLQFLDCICGSTTGGLGLLGLWINEHNVELINQTLESLTEYCQGPCHANQYAIINHESNGIDIVIALILNDIQPLSRNNVEMYLALKDNASKLLLAVMESSDDTANAERILYNITPKALIDIVREAYEQSREMDRQAEVRRVQEEEEEEKKKLPVVETPSSASQPATAETTATSAETSQSATGNFNFYLYTNINSTML